MILLLLVLLKAIIGLTIIDRLISINSITSIISVAILVMAFAKTEYEFVDISFVFMLCGFVGSLWILKVLTPVNWELKIPGLRSTSDGGEERDKERNVN